MPHWMSDQNNRCAMTWRNWHFARFPIPTPMSKIKRNIFENKLIFSQNKHVFSPPQIFISQMNSREKKQFQFNSFSSAPHDWCIDVNVVDTRQTRIRSNSVPLLVPSHLIGKTCDYMHLFGIATTSSVGAWSARSVEHREHTFIEVYVECMFFCLRKQAHANNKIYTAKSNLFSARFFHESPV